MSEHERRARSERRSTDDRRCGTDKDQSMKSKSMASAGPGWIGVPTWSAEASAPEHDLAPIS